MAIPNARMWKKGQSGNPGGRPKGIAALAREHTDKALSVLVKGMDSVDERVKVTAAKEILDRGWGKPLVMTADMTKKLDEFTDDDIDAALSFLRAALGTAEKAGAGKNPQNLN